MNLRKIIGYGLLIISVPPYIILFYVPFMEIEVKEMASYAAILYGASAVAWYVGLVLLGPEIVAKLKEYYQKFKNKLIRKKI
ncbi:MAG: hypothetical protein P8J93_07220 [SAR86 cluster bacterium]|nr:hypothetical protein [SAR86 cluster bacterium]|tara:strand:+ start:20038 stop:20283 length:246 start_codon:yes stop_codon:yes gene_type:complete